ncbi:MAG: DivIVA domain-containing protein [Candidatus Zixiibacteriota bacterium]|nr:MAG: DivIVA domain-containing protein [candidate division Zixibacteria bacterium]
MDLSPNDIRNYEFPSQMRGYDKEEVDNFLEQVAVALEEARQQNLKLSMETDTLKTQLAALKEFEDSIKNAAIDARRNADLTVANAKKEAEQILAEAGTKANEQKESHAREIAAIEQKLAQLEQTKRSYISELRSMMNSHLDMIDEIATADIKKDIHGESDADSYVPPVKEPAPAAEPSTADEPEEESLEVTESEDVTRQKVETLADQPEDKAIESEEANAAEAEVAAEEEIEQPAEPPKPIDPELAAALEQYKTKAERKVEDLNPEDFGPAPPQGTIIETDKTAEDVPSGFIAKVAEAELKAARTKAEAKGDDEGGDNGDTQEEDSKGLAPDVQDRPTEHNAIDMDQPTEEDKAKAGVSHDELAEALDGVVTKFEEEMDKAEKS